MASEEKQVTIRFDHHGLAELVASLAAVAAGSKDGVKVKASAGGQTLIITIRSNGGDK